MSRILYTLFLAGVLLSCNNDKEHSDKEQQDPTEKETHMPESFNRISDHAVLSLGVTDIEEAEAFWKQLGFSEVDRGTEPDSWVLLTDQSVYLSLNEDDAQYIGYLMYQPELKAFLDTVDPNIPKQTQEIKGALMHLFISPDSNALGIVETQVTDNINEKKLTNYMHYVQQGNFGLEKVDLPNAKLGIFGELSYPVKDIQQSITFWEKMGFHNDGLMQQPYPFAVMYDGQHIIGLHETQQFKQPGITYFAADQSQNIKKLKDQAIRNIKERKISNYKLYVINFRLVFN